MNARQHLTGWHAGPTGQPGGTYGLRFGRFRTLVEGRPKFIELLLAGEKPISVRVTAGFWNRCPEVRAPEIREWMQNLGITFPWAGGVPPKFPFERIGPNQFRVSRPKPIHQPAER
jgi:hypothetical protein